MIMVDFQAFTIKYSSRTNVLFSDVGISFSYNPRENGASKPPIYNVRAIWDTGATCTVITKEFAKEIGLVPSGKTEVTGIGKVSTLEDTFFVNIYLPNKVCIMNLRIAQVDRIAGNGKMLVGMDIIGSGDFSVYTENNQTVMTYRFPTIGGNDFVKEADNIRINRDILQKIEQQKNARKPVINKLKKKRKQERINRRKGRKNKKRK